jgi:hypothetical protein
VNARTAEIFTLHNIAINCLRVINGELLSNVALDSVLTDTNIELAQAIRELGDIPTAPSTHAIRAKASTVCRYVCDTKWEEEGYLPDDASLSTRACHPVFHNDKRTI